MRQYTGRGAVCNAFFTLCRAWARPPIAYNRRLYWDREFMGKRTSGMRYGIVVNPRSGRHSRDRKERVIREVAQRLGGGCPVVGLDTTCSAELAEEARRLSRQVDVLVIAGGDGTIADVINAMDQPVRVGLLPVGSANALACALGLPMNVMWATRRIAEGKPRPIDLILCDGSRKAAMTGVGIEAEILRRREPWLNRHLGNAIPYFLATAGALRNYVRTEVRIIVDGQEHEVRQAISVVVTKIPSYGFGLKLVPQARLDDGRLHVLTGNMGAMSLAWSLLKAFVVPNRAGQYLSGPRVVVECASPRWLEADGELCREGTRFEFEVLPGALTIQC
jgi:diacylglycerol kinase (ATP)